ncbi:MAG: MBL fold metallo-hydrolase [Limnohabitans sp.]|nr:MBL fold metallo-hydrolase [Limnohabitans sp.]
MTQRLQIPGLQVFERGWLSANNILLADDDCATLIDSGYVTHEAQTLALVQNALNGRPLDQLVNTHLHSDHCGGNHHLQTHYSQLETWIPPGEAKAVSIWDAEALSYEATGQLCPRFKFEGLLQVGQILRLASLNWEVHAAPGHDPHSVILFEPTHKILISADALWANGFGVVFPELEGVEAFHEVSQTLDLIESLKPIWVIPGHGAVFDNVDAALEIARKKLDGFVQSPLKHGRYGAKVLLKYKLLELSEVENTSFMAWASEVPYLKILHQTHAASMSLQEWLQDMLLDLERSNALAFQDNMIVNL